MLRVRPLLCLLPLVGLALTVVIYRRVYASEAGRYAGAEPALAGMWVAAPFLLLALVQILCVIGAYVSTTARGRTVCTAAAPITTGLGLLGWWGIATLD